MKDNPVVFLFSKMWKYSKGNRRTVCLFWIMFVIAGLIDLIIEPLILSKIISIIQNNGLNGDSLKSILTLLIALFSSTILFWSLHGPGRVLEIMNSFELRLNYRKFFLSGVLHLPMQWQTNHHSGDVIDKIEKGTSALYSFSEETFDLMYSFTRFVVAYSVLFFFNKGAGIIAVFFIFLSFTMTMRIDKVLAKNYSTLSKEENFTSQSIFDILSNITTVIILRVEKSVFDAIIHTVEKQRKLTKSTVILSETKWFISSVICSIMLCSVLGYYLYSTWKNNIVLQISSVYLLISYLNKIGELFFRFNLVYTNLIKWKTRTQNAEILSGDFKEISFNNNSLPEKWRELSIKGLNFSYDGASGLNLRDINLSLTRGQRVAFIGESGGGKTTMLKIIRALYDNHEGEVSVDLVPLAHGFSDIGDSIALLPQDPEIFDGTILYNLTLGVEFDQSDIDMALRVSAFSNVVERLPNGLQSKINEKGVNLSGGQKQRLALARGILASLKKEIILLDEATSSLDTHTEELVFDALFKVFEGKLVISSFHRMHLLKRFNIVVVFSHGSIVSMGRPIDVAQNCSILRVMLDKSGIKL